MSTANRVIKNTGFLYAKMGITMFISLYTTRLILNSLGASDFGIFNIVGGAISMLGFLNAAMASATQRFMSYCEGEGDKEKQKKIFNVSLILHIGIAFLVGIILLIAGYFFFNGVLNIPESRILAAKVVYGSLIVSTMFTIMTVPYDAAMNAHENMKYYAIIGTVESFLKLAVAIACVYTSYDKLIIYGFLMACIPLITLTIMRIYCHKHYNECIVAPRQYWDKSLMREITSFAGWNLFATAAAMITNYGLSIILNMYFGTILNAAQGIANQLNGQLGVFIANISKAVNPIITKSAGQNAIKHMVDISIFMSKIYFMINAISLIIFILYGKQILQWWLKDVPQNTYTFLILIMGITIGEIFLNSLSQILSAIGKIKGVSTLRSLTTLLCLPAIILAFHIDFPPYCMYVILFIKTIINIAISLYFCYLHCKISIMKYINTVILRCLASIIISFICMDYIKNVLNPIDFSHVIYNIILSAILSTIIIFFIIFKREERNQFKTLYISISKLISKK